MRPSDGCCYHAASIVGSQDDKWRLFIFGGSASSGSAAPLNANDVFCLDLQTMTWQRSTLKGYPPEPRKHHSMVSVGSQLYVFGGVDSAGRICENLLYVIDTASLQSIFAFTEGDTVPSRWGHTCSVIGRSLYLFGGIGLDGKHVTQIHVLDLAAMTWRELKAKGVARKHHSTAVVGSSIVITGGENKKGKLCKSVRVFDTVTSEWLALKITGPSPAPRCLHASCAVDAMLLLFGGKLPAGSKDSLYCLLPTEIRVREEQEKLSENDRHKFLARFPIFEESRDPNSAEMEAVTEASIDSDDDNDSKYNSKPTTKEQDDKNAKTKQQPQQQQQQQPQKGQKQSPASSSPNSSPTRPNQLGHLISSSKETVGDGKDARTRRAGSVKLERQPRVNIPKSNDRSPFGSSSGEAIRTEDESDNDNEKEKDKGKEKDKEKGKEKENRTGKDNNNNSNNSNDSNVSEEREGGHGEGDADDDDGESSGVLSGGSSLVRDRSSATSSSGSEGSHHRRGSEDNGGRDEQREQRKAHHRREVINTLRRHLNSEIEMFDKGKMLKPPSVTFPKGTKKTRPKSIGLSAPPSLADENHVMHLSLDKTSTSANHGGGSRVPVMLSGTLRRSASLEDALMPMLLAANVRDHAKPKQTEGWAFKLGKGGKRWHERWFRLVPQGGSLYYYIKPGDIKTKGRIPLEGALVMSDPQQRPGQPTSYLLSIMLLNPKAQEITLAVKTLADKQKWIEALTSMVNYIAYNLSKQALSSMSHYEHSDGSAPDIPTRTSAEKLPGGIGSSSYSKKNNINNNHEDDDPDQKDRAGKSKSGSGGSGDGGKKKHRASFGFGIDKSYSSDMELGLRASAPTGSELLTRSPTSLSLTGDDDVEDIDKEIRRLELLKKSKLRKQRRFSRGFWSPIANRTRKDKDGTVDKDIVSHLEKEKEREKDKEREREKDKDREKRKEKGKDRKEKRRRGTRGASPPSLVDSEELHKYLDMSISQLIDEVVRLKARCEQQEEIIRSLSKIKDKDMGKAS